MVAQVNGVGAATSATAASPPNDPRAAAALILQQTQIGTGPNPSHRIDFIEAALDAIADPAVAQAVRAEVMTRLNSVEQGELLRHSAGVTRDAGNGQTITFDPNSTRTQDQWIDAARTSGDRDYTIFAQVAGSHDNAAIKLAMTEVYNRQISPSQLLAERTAATGSSAELVELGLDVTQMTLDVVGIFDQTGVSDGANALISLGRRDWIGAGLSVLAAVPVFGALATAGKLGKWAQTVAKAVEMAANNPAARQALEPALRRIHDALKSAPDSVLRALPDGTRRTIEGIRTQLDGFFATAARQVDEVTQAGVRLNGSTLVIDGNRGAAYSVGGATGRIGDTPAVRTATDGRRIATDVDGNDVTLRAPRSFDTSVANADGTMTYTKAGRSVTYDANGFPVFNAKADLYLDARHIKSRDDGDHFRAANELLGNALRADPALARRMGLSDTQVAHVTRQPPPATPPADLTWHHHQDTGRIQLVDRVEHAHFSGGHTGGMKLWGGGRN